MADQATEDLKKSLADYSNEEIANYMKEEGLTDSSVTYNPDTGQWETDLKGFTFVKKTAAKAKKYPITTVLLILLALGVIAAAVWFFFFRKKQ
jgi:hypothetical protein